MQVPASSSPALKQFLTGHSANALSIGIQMVLIAWLAAGVLKLGVGGIALVQAAVLAPNLFLILFAGVLTDRHSPVRVLVWTNSVLVATHTAALLMLLGDYFDQYVLMIYAFGLGCCNSFIQSAREKLVALLDHPLQTNISLAGFCQYLAQGAGIILAALTDLVGTYTLVGLQILLCGLALAAYGGVGRQMIAAGTATGNLALAIRDALQLVGRQTAVRHVILLVAFNGLMHLGMFLVVLPVMARDRMMFTSLGYGFLQLCFTSGSVLAFWVIWRRKRIHYPGQAVLFCLLYTGLIGLALASGPTVLGLFSLIFLWGTVAGSSANLSRLVVQSIVPDTHRGRVMAVYQLALFGMAPLGALLAGTLVHWGGVELAFQVMAISSFVLFALSLLTRSLWSVQPNMGGSAEERAKGQ